MDTQNNYIINTTDLKFIPPQEIDEIFENIATADDDYQPPRKKRLYEKPPFNDSVMEKKRINAIKSHKARVAKKKDSALEKKKTFELEQIIAEKDKELAKLNMESSLKSKRIQELEEFNEKLTQVMTSCQIELVFTDAEVASG